MFVIQSTHRTVFATVCVGTYPGLRLSAYPNNILGTATRLEAITSFKTRNTPHTIRLLRQPTSYCEMCIQVVELQAMQYVDASIIVTRSTHARHMAPVVTASPNESSSSDTNHNARCYPSGSNPPGLGGHFKFQ
ncbi:hypothetical protein D6C77_10338 [Aureobasidium pullulans]|nr:hypothetical protein D6C79_08429 [Aureobasidium pullulans]TIA47120.1 hypothetical protein D6C77_10338 [Aureobasidium pullulans]